MYVGNNVGESEFGDTVDGGEVGESVGARLGESVGETVGAGIGAVVAADTSVSQARK